MSLLSYFCLVFGTPRSRPEPVVAARTTYAIPIDEQIADLAALLSVGISAGAYEHFCSVLLAQSLAWHLHPLSVVSKPLQMNGSKMSSPVLVPLKCLF